MHLFWIHLAVTLQSHPLISCRALFGVIAEARSLNNFPPIAPFYRAGPLPRGWLPTIQPVPPGGIPEFAILDSTKFFSPLPFSRRRQFSTRRWRRLHGRTVRRGARPVTLADIIHSTAITRARNNATHSRRRHERKGNVSDFRPRGF